LKSNITGNGLRHSRQIEDALTADALHAASEQSGYHGHRHRRQARGQEKQGRLPASREDVGVCRKAVDVEIRAVRLAE